MTFKCLLGNNRTNESCQQGVMCKHCGFEASENEKRHEQIRAGKLRRNKDGLMYLKVEGSDEI